MARLRQQDETILEGSQRTKFDFADFDHSAIPLEPIHYPVMIIGSSMIGMTLGTLLGYHGIKSISIDRHPSTATHPRAALFLLRSVEIFRQLGVEAELVRESSLNFDLDAGMLVLEQLVGGKVLAKLQEADPAKVAEITPCKRLWLTQNMFEPLVRTLGTNHGAEQIFYTRVIHYEEHDDGVIVVTENLETGQLAKYKTDYLVACDGNRSATRKKEGIEWHGPGTFGNNLSINFQANLEPFLGPRAVHGVTYVVNDRVNAGFRLETGMQKGFIVVARMKDRSDFAPSSITLEDAHYCFYEGTGLNPDQIDVQINSVSYWTVAAFNCERFSSKAGRVFLAGDAAHVMPPTGGMGGNTGIQDVHNLAWKLAYVVKGMASSSLLQSYGTERQPAAGQIVQQAFSRLVARVLPDKSIPHDEEHPDDVCELGYRYTDGAFVYDKDDSRSETWEDPRQPSALPGVRMPHLMLKSRSLEDSTLSTLDLVKNNFVLLTTSESSPWIHAASAQRIRIDAYWISPSSSPFYDPNGKFKILYRLQDDGAVLVRPDGLIAWRSPSRSPGLHDEILAEALDAILHR